MAYLSLTLWPLGEVDRARQLVADMMRRTIEITHVGTICFANMHAGYLEMMRGDPIQTDPFANALARLARDHDLKMWTAFGVFLEGWTAWQAGARDAGLAGMRDGVSQLAEQGVVVFDGLIKTKLAQAEADDGAIVAALTIIDQAIAVSERTGHRWFDAEIRRTRGEILFKQNPENPAPAEDAFLTAIAVAQSQKARSFELRAALSLAKLYRSSGRAAMPTPCSARRSKASRRRRSFRRSPRRRRCSTRWRRRAVKADAARRAQRLKLQTSYGQAVMWSKGFAAEKRKPPSRAPASSRPKLAMRRRLAKPIMSVRPQFVSRRVWVGPGGAPKASFAKRNARRGRRRWRPRIAFWDWFSSSKAISCRLGRIANRRCEFTIPREGEAKFRLGPDSKLAATSYLALAVLVLGRRRARGS